MRQLKLILFTCALFGTILFCSTSASAVSYALTNFNYDLAGGKVYGTSQTYLDYNLDPYYNAGVDGYLVKFNDLSLTSSVTLSSGSQNHSNNAIVLTVANVQRGEIYGVISDHFLQTMVYRNGYAYDPYGISYNFAGNGGSPYYGFSQSQPVYLQSVWFYLGRTGVIVALPNIQQVAPEGALPGTNAVVQIIGKYIGEHRNVPPVVSVSGNGVTAQFNAYLPNGVEVFLYIDENADTGNRTLSLTSDGVSSNGVNFRVGDRSPEIIDMTPPRANTGESVSVTITGRNFGSNPEVIIDGTGVTATVNTRTPTQIDAVFSVAEATYLGDRDIKVKSNGRLGMGFTPAPGNSNLSNPKPFTVDETNYTAAVQTVSFNADFPVKNWEDKAPIVDPTWKKSNSSGTNKKNVVAYKQGADAQGMNISATLNISPAPASNLQPKVRIKRDNQVVATESYSTTVNGSTIEIQEMFFSARLEQTPKVKKGEYTFAWEVSFDNGQTWKPSGTTNHVIYWTYGDIVETPGCEADGIYLNCLFANGSGGKDYAGLWDKALEKATTDELSDGDYSAESIAKILAEEIDDQITYNPGNSDNDKKHPLEAYTNRLLGVQCSVNANLLRGLLKSIGINNVETIYLWGGKPTTNLKKEDGGVTYGYKNEGSWKSFQAERPASNEGIINLPKDPHFTFHAMVKMYKVPYNDASVNLAAKVFDPSYGEDLSSGSYQSVYPYVNGDLRFKRAADLRSDDAANHKMVEKDETKDLVVRSFFAAYCLENENPDGTTPNCSINGHKKYSKTVSFIPSVTPPYSAFDAQATSTFSVWRPGDGIWYTLNAYTNERKYYPFGMAGDKITPGDYDGDGTTDPAVFRPGNQTMYIFQSGSQTFRTFTWNSAADKPVAGDYDGDGKSDIAFYHSDNGSKWTVQRSSDGSTYEGTFGALEDKPVSGDFDGDGKTDFATYRPSNGTWYWWATTDGTWQSKNFGMAGDIPTPGDYDGDGKTDPSVYRPSSNYWYVLYSGNGAFVYYQIGSAGDKPVPGDYDGDGKTDMGIWTPSNGHWLVRNSSNWTFTEAYWGGEAFGDVPVNAAYIY